MGLVAWCQYVLGFPGGSEDKGSTCSVGDLGLIPGWGRSPGGGHGSPLQYSCLENPQGHRSLWGYRLWGCTELDATEAAKQQQQPTGPRLEASPQLTPARTVWTLWWCILSFYLEENCVIARCGSPLNAKLTLSQWFSKEIRDERPVNQLKPALPLPEWQGNYF